LEHMFVEVYEFERRKLKLKIGLVFVDDEKMLMEGVGIGWRE